MSQTGESYDGGPVAALRRIAFLLERAREDTYKVKAFRGAAATILPMPDADARGCRRGRFSDRTAGDRRELGQGDHRGRRGRPAGAAGRPRA